MKHDFLQYFLEFKNYKKGINTYPAASLLKIQERVDNLNLLVDERGENHKIHDFLLFFRIGISLIQFQRIEVLLVDRIFVN